MDAAVFERVCIDLDGRPVLEDISFRVGEGAFLGVIGPNGAGKTTLLRALLGLVPVRSGTIRVLGRPPADHGRNAHAIGYVPQRETVPRNFPATVADIVMMGRLCCIGRWKRASAADWRKVRDELGEIGIGHLADRPIGRLSGGEMRRVLLAQALCGGTRLLVLDEPTVGLDLPAELEFYGLLRRLQKERGITIVCVSHDLLALAGQAERADLHQPPHARARQSRGSGAQPRAARGLLLRVRLPGGRDRAPRAPARRARARRARARRPRPRRAGLMFEYAFAERALAAAVIVGLLCGLLGFFVILRRLAFIGVGISHAAVGGVALGLILGVDPRLAAAVFSVAVALGMFWVARDRRLAEDAVIGVFLSGAMALGLLLMGLRHGYQKDLFSYLFGSLLAVTPADLAGLGLLAAALALIIAASFREMLFVAFDEEVARAYGRPVDALDAVLIVVLALTVVAAVRVVGVLLVEALLVVPAATAALWTLDFRRQVALSMGLGAAVGGRGAVVLAGLRRRSRRGHRARGRQRLLRVVGAPPRFLSPAAPSRFSPDGFPGPASAAIQAPWALRRNSTRRCSACCSTNRSRSSGSASKARTPACRPPSANAT